MTTVGTDEGRNYARLNLKLVDQDRASRSQKEVEQAIREELRPIAGVELTFGFNRPIFVNLLGPDPDTLSQLIASSQRGREGARNRRPRDLGQGRGTRRCRSASTTTPPPSSASPCSRSAPPCARCSPATP